MDDSNDLEARKQRVEWMKKYRNSLDSMNKPEMGGQEIGVQPSNVDMSPSATSLSNARDVQNYQGGQATHDAGINPMAAAEMVGNTKLKPELVQDEMHNNNLFAHLKAAKQRQQDEEFKNTSRSLASVPQQQPDDSQSHILSTNFNDQVKKGEEQAQKNPLLFKLFQKLAGQ